MRSFGSFQSVWNRLRPFFVLGPLLAPHADAAVAPHPPGQVAHEGARRVANRGGAHRALQHGGEEGAEELVRDGPQLLFALLRFLCRPGRWSTRLKLQRPPEGSAQVDGNVAKIDLAARGVDGALAISTHHHGQSEPVQYHPPRLSEDRLNLPQPHSPSLPTSSGKSGMRPSGANSGDPRTVVGEDFS